MTIVSLYRHNIPYFPLPICTKKYCHMSEQRPVYKQNKKSSYLFSKYNLIKIDGWSSIKCNLSKVAGRRSGHERVAGRATLDVETASKGAR